MENEIIVSILNWNALDQNPDSPMAIAAGRNGGLFLSKYSADDPSQQWRLIPNLDGAATTGGYSIQSVIYGSVARQPDEKGKQIQLNHNPAPTYGEKEYCWTIWPAGQVNNEDLWAIQSYQRGLAMDAFDSGVNPGTQVIFWPWNGNNNQKWIIRRYQ